MRRIPGIAATANAEELANNLPESFPYLHEKELPGRAVRLTLRRCYRQSGDWGSFSRPGGRTEFTGGAVLTVSSTAPGQGACRKAHCTIRLKPGWSKLDLARAINRGIASVNGQVVVNQARHKTEERFGNPPPDIVQEAEDFAASISWDGAYDTLTQEQAEQFQSWMDAKEFPRFPVSALQGG